MIKLIIGKKGSGKTKKIIDMANSSLDTNNGNTVFISDTNRYMYDIKRAVRFLLTKEYKIDGQEQLLAFLKGVIASNSDNNLIFIDGLARILKLDIVDMQSFYEGLDTIADEYDIDFILTVSAEELPDFMSKYTIIEH